MKAHEAIEMAMNLGILCRPVEPGWSGSALQPSDTMFHEYSPEYSGHFWPSPLQLTKDWELTTLEKIRKEYDAPIGF